MVKNQKNNKIDFVIIGPGKSGTTWLFQALKTHPKVQMATSKETLFFEKYHHKGINWFHNFFDFYTKDLSRGEVSNTYIFEKQVAKNLFDYNPNIKLITSLRNPVDRTFSHYLYMLKIGEAKGTFEKVLNERKDLYKRGEYYELLQPFYNRFSKEQIKVLVFEDLKNNTNKYWSELCDFLEIEKIEISEELKKKVLPASHARNQFLSRVTTRIAAIVRDFGFPQIISQIKYNKTISKILYTPYKNNEKPKMSPVTRKHLENYFAEDVKKLSELLNIDFCTIWNINNAA